MIGRILKTMIILCLLVGTAQAGWRSKTRAGDKLYQQGQYDEALVKYLEALGQGGDSTRIDFGLGNVLDAQEKFPDAAKAFSSALISPDSSLRADGFYNLGNALVGAQKYQEAVEAYKTALKLKPGQRDYLHNLELALHLLQNPPPQQQDQGGQDQQEPKDKEQDQEQKQDQQQEQESQQQQPEQQPQQDQPHEQQEQGLTQPESMSKEDAERLLNALQTNEKQVQENLRKKAAVEAGVSKDW